MIIELINLIADLEGKESGREREREKEDERGGVYRDDSETRESTFSI